MGLSEERQELGLWGVWSIISIALRRWREATGAQLDVGSDGQSGMEPHKAEGDLPHGLRFATQASLCAAGSWYVTTQKVVQRPWHSCSSACALFSWRSRARMESNH